MVKSLSIRLIRIYQYVISPWLRPSCRYLPTCSSYSIEAFEKHGFLKGARLGLGRMLRCHPWGGSGYDPVPSVEAKQPQTKQHSHQ